MFVCCPAFFGSIFGAYSFQNSHQHVVYEGQPEAVAEPTTANVVTVYLETPCGRNLCLEGQNHFLPLRVIMSKLEALFRFWNRFFLLELRPRFTSTSWTQKPLAELI